MNTKNIILRSETHSPLTTKNSSLSITDFDNNNINIYEDFVDLATSLYITAYDVNTIYNDSINKFCTYNGLTYQYIANFPSSGNLPTDTGYFIEIFPTQLAHQKNRDTILDQGGANEVSASEIKSFISAGLTSTTNLSITGLTNNSLVINSSTGTDITLTQATTTTAGLLTSQEKIKINNLNGINTGDQTLDSLNAEDRNNKVNNFTTINSVTYPTTEAVDARITSQVPTLMQANGVLNSLSGGTSGRVAKFTTGSILENSVIRESSDCIAINGATDSNIRFRVVETGSKVPAQIINNNPSTTSNCTALSVSNNQSTTGYKYGINVLNTGSANESFGAELRSQNTNNAGKSVGAYISAEGTTSNKYAVRLVDGTEGVGKLLKCVDGGGYANWTYLPAIVQLAVSDETTALTTGNGKLTFRMPHAMELTEVRASLTTAQASGSVFTIDINESGASVLSTKLTIDNNDKTSVGATIPAVISDTSLSNDAEITIDIDQIGNGTAKGLKITLIGTREI